MKTGLNGNKKGIIITFVLLLALGCIVFVWINKPPRAKSGPIKVVPSSTTKTPDTVSDSSPAKTATAAAGNSEDMTAQLIAPYGTLVSNHRPGQNGTSLTEVSQCTTTPGAKCSMKFTQGDIVKTLPERTTDSSGSVFWNWSIKDAGLTSGKWSVTATATLNNQTKSTMDQLSLEVQ